MNTNELILIEYLLRSIKKAKKEKIKEKFLIASMTGSVTITVEGLREDVDLKGNNFKAIVFNEQESYD